MRIAVLGAAAAALLGGTLAITPLITVGTPVRAPRACGNGVAAACERLASVLMPETATGGTPAACRHWPRRYRRTGDGRYRQGRTPACAAPARRPR